MIAKALVSLDDILYREADIGDFVLFFTFDVKEQVCRTDVGIVARTDVDGDGYFINGKPRYKAQVLFVLNLKGYNKHLEFNPYRL